MKGVHILNITLIFLLDRYNVDIRWIYERYRMDIQIANKRLIDNLLYRFMAQGKSYCVYIQSIPYLFIRV